MALYNQGFNPYPGQPMMMHQQMHHAASAPAYNGGGYGGGNQMNHVTHYFHSGPQQVVNGGGNGLPPQQHNGHMHAQAMQAQPLHQLHQQQQQQLMQQQQQQVAQAPQAAVGAALPKDGDEARIAIFEAIKALYAAETREAGLQDLSKNKEAPFLGFFLWHSTGVVAILLQELVSAYPLLSTSTATTATSTRVGNAMTALQAVATNDLTRKRFIDAGLLNYYIPFLSMSDVAGGNSRPAECIRLTALGFIGTIAKLEDPAINDALQKLEIVPICLNTMRSGTELCRTLATFIVQKLLSTQQGLAYMCQNERRIEAVVNALQAMLESTEGETPRILRLAFRCFSAFIKNPAALSWLAKNVPKCLRDERIEALAKSDDSNGKQLLELRKALGYQAQLGV